MSFSILTDICTIITTSMRDYSSKLCSTVLTYCVSFQHTHKTTFHKIVKERESRTPSPRQPPIYRTWNAPVLLVSNANCVSFDVTISYLARSILG